MQRNQQREPDAEDNQRHEEMAVGEDGFILRGSFHLQGILAQGALDRTWAAGIVTSSHPLAVRGGTPHAVGSKHPFFRRISS